MSGGIRHDSRVIEGASRLGAACGRRRCGSGDKPVEIAAVLRFDELDCEAIGQSSDNAADAGSDGQGHSNWRLHLGGHRDTRDRHVDDKAAMSGTVGQDQS
jgi:hypothetical protein